MALLSSVTYNADGTTDNFSLTFNYLDRDHVFVTVNDVAVPFTFNSDSVIKLTTMPANGDVVHIFRVTPRDVREVVFKNPSIQDANDFNLNSDQLFYLIQESLTASDANAGELVSLADFVQMANESSGESMIGQISYFAQNPGPKFLPCNGSVLNETDHPYLIFSGLHSNGYSYNLQSVSRLSDVNSNTTFSGQISVCSELDDCHIVSGTLGGRVLFYTENGVMKSSVLNIPSSISQMYFIKGPQGAAYDMIIYRTNSPGYEAVYMAKFNKIQDFANPQVDLFDNILIGEIPQIKADFLIKALWYKGHLVVMVSGDSGGDLYISPDLYHFRKASAIDSMNYPLNMVIEGDNLFVYGYNMFFMYSDLEDLFIGRIQLSPDYTYGPHNTSTKHSWMAVKGSIVATLGLETYLGMNFLDLSTMTEINTGVAIPQSPLSVITVEDQFLVFAGTSIYQTQDGSSVTQLIDLSSVDPTYNLGDEGHAVYDRDKAELIIFYSNLSMAMLLNVERTVSGVIKLTPKMPDQGNASPYIRISN